MMSEPKARSALSAPPPQIGPFAQLIFGSRWLQAPLYLGLIVAQASVRSTSSSWSCGTSPRRSSPTRAHVDEAYASCSPSSG